MIPRLASGSGLDPEYRTFLDELRLRGFEGDIQTDYATRLVTATDNSVYQVVPEAVIFPRHADDVARALALLSEPQFRSIKVSPRGGGTGTNGQSLCHGVIMDVSRYMRSIGRVDLEAGWVEVEPG